MYAATKGQRGITARSRARASSSATRTIMPAIPCPARALGTPCLDEDDPVFAPLIGYDGEATIHTRLVAPCCLVVVHDHVVKVYLHRALFVVSGPRCRPYVGSSTT